MTLTLVREIFTNKSTIGSLYVDGTFECYTLEDTIRPVKIKNETAIPLGTYRVRVDYSKHFKREMPHILDVPNFEGIRIHSGNTDADTEGCVLVGKVRGSNRIEGSRKAYTPLFDKIKAAIARNEDVGIEIKARDTTGILELSKALKNVC